MTIDAKMIEKEALAEIAKEDRRAAVELAKGKIRQQRNRPWWKRLLPFSIEIHRN